MPEIYKPTVDGGWRKPMPSDPTSPHWYDQQALARLVFAHVRDARNGGHDVPIGEFVRSFRGLSSTVKARAVRAAVPGVESLADLERDPSLVAVLLAAMREHARTPGADVLGRVPEVHYRTRLDGWFGVQKFWFRRVALVHDGVPWVLEVAVAATDRPGDGVYATNFSPTFGDPLARTPLVAGDVEATGVDSLLRQAGAYPNGLEGRAAALHVLCPALEFLDRGKSSLVVPNPVAQEFAVALKRATKELRAERKRRDRDWKARARSLPAPATPRTTLKDAVFAVLPDALAAATGDGELPVSARSLFYSVRPRVQKHTDTELSYDYFSQSLLIEYRELRGAIPGLYFEPRGELHEPHSGASLALGTREVESYNPPDWTFDKILYVEKTGLLPVLQAARLGDRYDLAVIASNGYASEACRTLLARAHGDSYRLFVLHDADPDGYNIARTLAEETRRMPGHHVEIVDLGLAVADAIEHELPSERFTRKRALPAGLDLDPDEQEWFVGQPVGRHYTCRRVELNAFTGPELIRFIERGLAAHGAATKVIPPEGVLSRYATLQHRALAHAVLEQALAERLDLDALASELANDATVNVTEREITDALASLPPLSWRDVVAQRLTERLGDELRASAEELLAARWSQGEGRPS